MAITPYTVSIAVAQVLFVLFFSPLLIGVIRKVKARFQARQGASVFQPYFDLMKLLMKGTVKSSTTSWIFDLAPTVNFITVLIAAIILPMFSGDNVFSSSNVILFVYVFVIGRFFMTLGGLDAASSFGGLGSSREMLLSAFVEPAMMSLILFLSISASGATDISAFAQHTAASWQILTLQPPQILAAIALVMVILAEMKRMPFDNPATHLELTMVHEAMILENSGPNLALMEWSNAAKLVVFFSLFGLLFTPVSLLWQNPAYAFLALAAVSLVMSVIVAVIESVVVKVRLFKVTEILMLCFIVVLLAFLSVHYQMEVGSRLAIVLLIFVMLLSAILFLLSATFASRLKLFLINSLALALISMLVAVSQSDFDSYFRLASTVIIKVVLVPLLLYMIFKRITKPQGIMGAERAKYRKSEFEKILTYDPLFMTYSSILTTLVTAGCLVLLSFLVSSALHVTDIMMPLTISLILIGMLIITTKSHIMLQLFGLLIMENGIVLFPLATSIRIPLLAEAATVLDAVVFLAVGVALIVKTNEVTGTLDSHELSELLER